MPKAVKKSSSKSKETDNIYFLKILIYFVLGTVWIKYNGYVVFPLGLIIGVLIAQKDHFAIDRKVEYAILLISAIIGLLAGGFYLVI
ncbi:MAG TPA: hypothetical protein VMS08_02860 [Candidatus Saccharimonadia bacterium]|nr:hypothetical protein [Candidatus Saccharimonadia bacterium]